MKKFLLALVVVMPILVWGERKITDSTLLDGSLVYVIETSNSESQMHDATLQWLANKFPNSISGKTITNRGFIVPIEIPIYEGSNISEILLCNLSFDFKESKARVQVAEMRIYEKNKQYDTFSKHLHLLDYCFVDSVEYKTERLNWVKKIEQQKIILNGKSSKKEKKEAEHQLEIAKSCFAHLELSFKNDVQFNKPRNRERIIKTLEFLLDDIETTVRSSDDW